MTGIKTPGWIKTDTVRAGSRLRRGPAGYFHWCPGCEAMHALPDNWTFDGNLEAPTFSPSFKHTFGDGRICHYILTAGQLKYCDDSVHSLAGKSVPLPILPKEYPA